LTVAVHERDEIESLLDRKVVTDLLVAAIPLVDGVEQDVQGNGMPRSESRLFSNVSSCDASSSTSTSTSYSSARRGGTRARTALIFFSAL
jgi:hypothetical protein